jgi:CubicO group peptidase (beta-lactamase class C family)
MLKSRADRLHDALRRHVAEGALPGAVALVARGDDVHVGILGTRSIGGPPMTRDTIFRIASMSKPITAAGALALVDDGTLRIDDPIDRWLPELADRRVLVRPDGPLADTVPARRAITVRDLLTYCMGFGMLWGAWDAPVVRAANELELGAFGPPHPQQPPSPDEWLRRFATLPLMHQPGERWLYNTSCEVLCVLIARASRRPLDAFLRERIFEPLGMHDTGFHVPTEKLARLATSYFVAESGALELYDDVRGEWATPPAFPSGAAGLVSTIDDFSRFARMLLGAGQLGGMRVLSEHAVAEMTSDRLSPDQKREGSLAPGFFATRGWGYGVAVTTARDDYGAQPGTYGWDGGLGTSWRNDPGAGTITILLTQASAYPDRWPVYRDFWTEAHAAPRDAR